MNKVVIVLLLVALCGIAFTVGESVCICQMSHEPVCDSATGITYANQCMASCGGVVTFTTGECAAK